jgi:hypothetical protein
MTAFLYQRSLIMPDHFRSQADLEKQLVGMQKMAWRRAG